MMPDKVLSTQVIAAAFLAPRDQPKHPLIDYSLGGVAIQDASQGLRSKIWTGEMVGDTVTLSAPGVTPVGFLSVSGITEFSFTFDQNMNPFITYATGGSCFYYWFDTTLGAYVTTALPAGSANPRCSLDDPRDLQSAASDILLAYIRAQTLCLRAQRDRYLIEYALGDIGSQLLLQVGMNRVNRFQFQLASIS